MNRLTNFLNDFGTLKDTLTISFRLPCVLLTLVACRTHIYHDGYHNSSTSRCDGVQMKRNKEKRIIRMSQVYKLLKEGGPRKHSELLKATEIPEKTMDRILADWRDLGLIQKRPDAYWSLVEHLRKPYKTKAEKDDALEHSVRLIPGLECILTEYRRSHPDNVKAEADALKVEIEAGPRLKELAEQHLKTGYPSISRQLEGYRGLMEDARLRLGKRKYPKRIVDFVIEGIITFPNTIEDMEKWPLDRNKQPPEDLVAILNRKNVAHSELEREIRKMEFFIQVGTPLDGICEACKDITIHE